MSGDPPSSAGSPEYRRSNTVASQWPADVDLDALYASDRADVDELVRSAADMSVWSLETRKDNALVYVHSKNSERLAYSVRAVTKVAGSVAGVLECLRSPDNASLRAFQKVLHPRNFLDGEVLHSDRASATANANANANPSSPTRDSDGESSESMALKWMVYSSPKTLGRSKEFCLREYCVLLRDHPVHGDVGVCRFESYDGAGARYGLRGKPDAYSLTVFEPSAVVVQRSAEDPGTVSVTLTFAMRKARGGESVSTGVRLTSLRLAGDFAMLQRAVQQTMFAPAALAQRNEWVTDAQRANCSLCVQSFGMLKRRHHCRVCGEVVCSACTVFKLVTGVADTTAKVRVCKACLAKSASSANSNGTANTTNGIANTTAATANTTGITTDNTTLTTSNGTELEVAGSTGSTPALHSICSTSSLTSDESHSPPSENPAAVTPPLAGSTYSQGSALSLNDFENTSPVVESPPPYHAPREGRTISSSRSTRSTRKKSSSERRIHYFNEDLEEICLLAMETLTCPMAGIRTEDFELVRYYDGQPTSGLPRSLPTFRRLATRGKPCIVLDVSSDKRISGDKRFTAKLQFFVGVPLLVGGEVVGDLCVADRYARDQIDQKEVEVLNVLGETVTQYMQSLEYQEDLAEFKASQPPATRRPPTSGGSGVSGVSAASAASDGKEVAF
ncbi:hypothetical protein BBJ28_00020274 [Nothophytophthora sp. Chile5]|nr:hypothetical protein BBJ28_00020274 [Nothophytophthora sp. Chile5]